MLYKCGLSSLREHTWSLLQHYLQWYSFKYVFSTKHWFWLFQPKSLSFIITVIIIRTHQALEMTHLSWEGFVLQTWKGTWPLLHCKLAMSNELVSSRCVLFKCIIVIVIYFLVLNFDCLDNRLHGWASIFHIYNIGHTLSAKYAMHLLGPLLNSAWSMTTNGINTLRAYSFNILPEHNATSSRKNTGLLDHTFMFKCMDHIFPFWGFVLLW